jgi:hypothetical protein
MTQSSNGHRDVGGPLLPRVNHRVRIITPKSRRPSIATVNLKRDTPWSRHLLKYAPTVAINGRADDGCIFHPTNHSLPLSSLKNVRNQVVSSLVWLWWVIDLARFEFESGIVSFCFSFTFVSFRESCLLVLWCAGGRCGMACIDEDRGRSRRLGAEDRGWSQRSGTQWPGDREDGWRRVWSTPCTWRRGAWVSWLSRKTKVDGLWVVWPQNHSDDFSLVWASKPMPTVCEWFGLKTTRTVFTGLASKPMVTVSSGLASKPAAMVSSGLALKPAMMVSSGLA